MSVSRAPQPSDIDDLLLNAQLRDEMEPYQDEAVQVVNFGDAPTRVENEYLASMLAWERAPTLPIARWFHPELALPHPDALSDRQLHQLLWDTIHKLYARRIVLDFTDHLSDRELYTLILRDILPLPEKVLDRSGHYLHFDCTCDRETWLAYYASEEERRGWAAETCDALPPRAVPTFHRKLPGQPL
jgi:hypothetical protein